MRIGVLEWASSGNAIGSESLPPSIRMEGWAMCRAVILSLIDGGHQAVAVVDSECAQDPSVAKQSSACLELHIAEKPGLQKRFSPLSQWRSVYGRCDCTLVIAPEFHGVLDELVQWFKDQGMKTCNCGQHFIRRTSDKWRTARRLFDAGLPHPPTRLLSAASRSWVNGTTARMRSVSGAEPIWVIKPRDGVGCDGIIRVTAREIAQLKNKQGKHAWNEKELSRFVVQPWLTGIAMSRACLTDLQGSLHWLPVSSQVLSIAERVEYQGGTVEPDLAQEIPGLDDLLDRAIQCIGGRPRGWLGVDFLWDRESPTQPVTIIEINPRLTTSFVGLRAAGAPELASNIVAACRGQAFQLPTDWHHNRFSVNAL